MRLESVNSFDDEEMPTSATFRLSLDEIAVLYRFTGHVAPVDISTASGSQKWADASDEVASCLGSFINRYWENGVDDVAPRFSVDSIYGAKRMREANKDV